jgi:hypothetical protein
MATKVTPLLGVSGLTTMNGSTYASNLAPGATATLTETFAITSGRPGSKVDVLSVGDATGVNPNGSIAIPALWAEATTVTLP